MKKVCVECKEIKDISLFGKLSSSKDGLKAKCKECTYKYNKEHPIKHDTRVKLNNNRLEKRRIEKEMKIKNGDINVRFDNGQLKECNHCGEIKPYSSFHNNSHCKGCEKVRFAKWYNGGGNRKMAEYQKKYRKENIDKCKLWAKKSRNNTPKEETSRRGKEWREKNKDRIKKLKREWRKKNPEKDREYNNKRRDRISSCHISANKIKDIVLKSNNKCYWCGDSIQGTPHIDHYIPLSRGGLNTIDNIVVSCSFCNLSKGSLDPIKFANKIGKLL